MDRYILRGIHVPSVSYWFKTVKIPSGTPYGQVLSILQQFAQSWMIGSDIVDVQVI